jgi:hypothetical protein
MKNFLIFLALGGISMWFIFNTYSLFNAQHSFINIDPVGSQIECRKCHGDIDMEIHSGSIHSNLTCSDCHRIQKNIQFASGDDAYARLIYVNATANIPNRVLATTLQNYQRGNFPESISGEITIDQWAEGGNDDVQFRDGNNEYRGNMTAGETGILYIFDNGTEMPTYIDGVPRDEDELTKYEALDIRIIKPDIDPNGSDNLTGAGSRMTTSGTSAHAASTILCADCHSEYLNNTPDTVHEVFMKSGNNTNNNCIACHTSTGVSINWTRPSLLVIETTSNGSNIMINNTYLTENKTIVTSG